MTITLQLQQARFFFMCSFLSLLLALTGCSILPPGPGSKTAYVLENRVCQPPSEKKPEAPSLILRDPTAAQLINSHKIIFRKDLATRSYYQLAEWVEPPPSRFAALLLEALECSALFKSVTLRSKSTDAQFALQTELVEFMHDTVSDPTKVLVTVRAELIDLESRQIMDTRTFTKSLELTQSDAPTAVAQFNSATNLILDDLVAWLGQLMHNDRED